MCKWGAHLIVSSCLVTGKQVAQGPGQVYLAAGRKGKMPDWPFMEAR